MLGTGATSRVYRNQAARVHAFIAPAGWEAATQASYPRLLTLFVHPSGARITLAMQRVAATTTAAVLAAENRALLERSGYHNIELRPDGARVRLEATLDGKERFLKQAYLVDGDSGYVMSLVGLRAQAAQLTRDFESALASLVISSPEE